METKVETKEKSFEELVAEAKIIGDKRRRVFNTLINNIKTRFIPALATVMTEYNVSEAFFEISTNFNGHAEKFTCGNGSECYLMCIDHKGNIHNAFFNHWNYTYNSKEESTKAIEYDFKKNSAIEIAEEIKRKIIKLNKKYSEINEEAERMSE